MSVPHTLLGLLEREPAHGYSLKLAYDERFGRERPLRFGQVYATLTRLERDGWVSLIGVDPGDGPDRKTYAITSDGVSALDEWITTPEPAAPMVANALFVKIVLALLSGRSAELLLAAQERVHLARMREITSRRGSTDPVERLAGDYEIAHLEADLRWIHLAGQRLDQLDVARSARTTDQEES